MNPAANALLDSFKAGRLSLWEGNKAFISAAPVRSILEAPAELQGLVAEAALEAVLELRTQIENWRRPRPTREGTDPSDPGFMNASMAWNQIYALQELIRQLLIRKAFISPEQLSHMLTACARLDVIDNQREHFVEKLVECVEKAVRETPGCVALVSAVRQLVARDNFCDNPKAQALKQRLWMLIEVAPKLPVMAGEAWADELIAALATSPIRDDWSALLAHCHGSTSATPGERWLRKAEDIVKTLGQASFREHLVRWFDLVDKPRTQPKSDWNTEWKPDPNQLIIEPHANILKGLAWCCGLKEDRELARALMALALSSYRKVPKRGPRLASVGNACVTALGMMPGMEGVGQLALLKVKVKFGTAQKVIEKALEVTAKRVGLPREDLEEMAVPAYGLTGVGVCEEPLGEFTARLTVAGNGATELVWLKPDGKPQKAVPASVKTAHAEELRELQAAAKDIQKMLPAQRERLDGLFLAQ